MHVMANQTCPFPSLTTCISVCRLGSRMGGTAKSRTSSDHDQFVETVQQTLEAVRSVAKYVTQGALCLSSSDTDSETVSS